ncbi:hypothetical protein [Trichormus variabilis]|nr:hypothetical protein [Trichormus variabilis]MBD2625688.1 hypothetical protein [Trichormus variabilis FACHB-164]
MPSAHCVNVPQPNLHLADDFVACIGLNAPILSDYAVNSESIYEYSL